MQQPPAQNSILGSQSVVRDADDGQEKLPAENQRPADDSGGFSAASMAQAQWLGNEFNALRAEFIQRFQTENLLVLGALTFLGTTLTIAFKDSSNVNNQVLLVLPIVLPLVGIFYINQRLSNSAIGIYVRDDLAPKVCTLLHSEVLAWETYVRSNTSAVKELTLFLFILTIFAGPGPFILVYTRTVPSAVTNPFAEFAWWTGAVLTAIWVALWVHLYRDWFGPKK